MLHGTAAASAAAAMTAPQEAAHHVAAAHKHQQDATDLQRQRYRLTSAQLSTCPAQQAAWAKARRRHRLCRDVHHRMPSAAAAHNTNLRHHVFLPLICTALTSSLSRRSWQWWCAWKQWYTTLPRKQAKMLRAGGGRRGLVVRLAHAGGRAMSTPLGGRDWARRDQLISSKQSPRIAASPAHIGPVCGCRAVPGLQLAAEHQRQHQQRGHQVAPDVAALVVQLKQRGAALARRQARTVAAAAGRQAADAGQVGSCEAGRYGMQLAGILAAVSQPIQSATSTS